MQTKNLIMIKDEVANLILTDKSCKDYVETIVSKALGIDKDKISLELVTNRLNNNVNLKYSYADVIYEDKTFMVNIEVNLSNTKSTKHKNMRYICHLLLNNTKPGDLERLNKKIYQINLNTFDIFNKKEFIYKSNMREERYNLLRDDYLMVVDINLAYLRKLSYNEIKKKEEHSLEKLLYIFVCEDINNLEELYAQDKLMIKVRDKMIDLTKDFMDGIYYDHEEFMDRQAYELGEEAGIKNNQIEIAKELIKNNLLSNKDIAKITKLSLKEIKKIAKDIKKV